MQLHSSPTSNASKRDGLQAATRAHANFAENVPLAFVVANLAELNGASSGGLKGALGALWALRVLHADFGMIRPAVGRPIGYAGT